MVDLSFSHPYALLLLELVPLLFLFYFRNYRHQRSVIQLSTFSGFQGYQKTLRQRIIHTPFILRSLSISLLIIAISDPKSAQHQRIADISKSEIIYVTDLSAAMLAKDFDPNRMESLKASLSNFISRHKNIPSGLASFATDASIECALTDDFNTLQLKLDDLQVSTTAFSASLNQGLSTGIDLLNQGSATHKFLICFTGSNNSGGITDEELVHTIEKDKITVIIVAIASEGLVESVARKYGKLVYQNTIINLDEQVYRLLTAENGGEYFRVTSNSELDTALLRISQLVEQDKTTWSRSYAGIFPFGILAAFLLGLELVLRYTFLKSLP